MKPYITILLGIFLFCKGTNAQNFEWTKRAGLYAFDLGYAVGTDNAGNVYFSGKYEENANFGGTTVSCAGNHDIYLAKYSASGVFQWVRHAGGPSGDYTHAMCVDGDGNSYITGEYEYTTYFGSVPLVSYGNNDIFLAKYDTHGTLIWVKKVGASTSNDRGLGVSLSNGHLYLTGRFIGKGIFANTTTVYSAGGVDIFVAKYTTAGDFEWVKRAGGSADDEGFAISNDISGNAYVTGYFTGTANFSGTSITSSGGTDIFIAKYSPDGNLIWVKKAGAGASDVGNGIKVDNAGRVFVTGGFRLTSHFGAITIAASGGNSDIFLACYDGSGNAVWVKKAGGSLNDAGRAVAVDASSNTFITGNFGKTATFGPQTLYGVDSCELFFASYDVNGNFRWVLKAGGPVDASDPLRFIEMGLSIATDHFGNVYASGTYRSSSTFGSTTLSPWSTHTDIFLTKISGGAVGDRSPINATVTPSDTASFCTGGSLLLKAAIDPGASYLWMKNGEPINGASAAAYKANAPGSYSVLIIKGNDSLISQPTVVLESKNIQASILPTGLIFCKDSNTVLKATPGDDYVYQWKRNGSSIPGANREFYKPDQSGEYQVKVIEGSCFEWSETVKIVVRSCGKADSISEKTAELNAISQSAKEDSLIVKIYPNPNNGLFMLELNMAHSSEQPQQAKVEVVNAIGQIVFVKLSSCINGCIKEHIELDNSIPTGIYFLQVTVGDKVEKTRMMLCR